MIARVFRFTALIAASSAGAQAPPTTIARPTASNSISLLSSDISGNLVVQFGLCVS
jgi:hypothetical protein